MTWITVPKDIAERAEGFVGREWVLDEVAEWMDHGAGRFLLITGEPGSGKTALAAWLAGAGPSGQDAKASSKLARVRDEWGAGHFCNARGQSGTLNPNRFAQSLAHQLSDFYDDYAEAVLRRIDPQINIHLGARQNWGRLIGAKIENLIVDSNALDMYNRTVREPLEVLFGRRPNLRLFILVDALDEALTFGLPNIVTLLAGSDDLPPSVRFLLTSRNEPRVLEQFDQIRRLDLSEARHDADANADIRAYVQQRLAEDRIERSLAGVGPPQGVEDAIVAYAAGNFLYAEFLLDEVADGKRSLEDLVSLPRGLYGLYRSFLNRLIPGMLQAETNVRWAGQFQPLLGSLSVATPSAPHDILPRWLGRPEGEVEALLDDVIQVTEYDDSSDGGGYRLYHVSMAEFLASKRYQENGAQTRNRYYTPTREQHQRIIRYYLTNFGKDRDGWEDCDPYGLRQLVGHMQAGLAMAETSAERRRQAQEMYAVVFDETFRTAQLEKLGDLHTTLSDLRTALDVALERDDMVEALKCVGIYRDTIRSRSITEAIFGTIREGDFERALQQVSHYEVATKPRGNWEQVLLLYLAWEAAEQHNTEAVQKVMASARHLPRVWGNELRDALLARVARTLASIPGGARDARSWLAQLEPGPHADSLLAAYEPAQPLDSVALCDRLAMLNRQLDDFRRLVDEGNPEAISVAPLLDEEWVGDYAHRLRVQLTELALTEEGEAAIDEALDLVLPNPYPRYRDIGLVALGVACLLVPDPSWVRTRLQSILRTALEQEGVTFAFDLPSILLEESRKHEMPARQLSDHLSEALESNDRWGTAIRAHSARAAALFRQGRTDEAFEALSEAGRRRSGFAGYGTLALLSLANRCYEFGQPERADEPIWGSYQDTSLLQGAEELGRNVREREFREERLRLVQDYREWAMQSTPDVDTVLATLAETTDADTRRAYKDHVSARWASPNSPNREGLKKLVPMALADATTLDAVLGRLFGLSLSQLTRDDLADAVRICCVSLITDRTG